MPSENSADPLFLAFQESLAGRYSIDRELGRGGAGIVYLAREVHLDRLVAIKLLPPDRAADPTLRERFLREVRLVAKLSHPNIIPIHGVEDSGGFVFYVMAFIDGETLANRVRTRGPLSSSDGARILREAAWALSYAHGQGFVHRDVKPDNILIENTGRVLVADFGIAAVMGDTIGEGVSGTPEFMSPEQVLGKETDARSDLYALGATAFFAFSGRFPFEGATPTEILAKQVTEPAPPLASIGLPVPRKLASIVDRCLAKDPELRPASAIVLAEQLTTALEQRREVPAALRAFVKRDARLNGPGTMILMIGLVPLSVTIAVQVGRASPSLHAGMIAGWLTFGLGAVLPPVIYATTIARRLLLQGFSHADLHAAFRAEIEQTEEELTLNTRGQPVLRRGLGFLAATSFASWAVSVAAAVLDIGTGSFLEAAVGLTGGATLLSTVAWLSVAQRAKDMESAFWSHLWLGRLGRGAFTLAKKLTGNRTRQHAMTHRATELSLGLAAEQLFESLPRETRLELSGLPPVLQRLQADAQTLRQRYDTACQALADVGDATAPAYADVREMRDAAHGKLGEAVGALETIRLNLLRLHAGSTTVASITTHLGIAREVSEEVERLIAAHDDVESFMKYPRLAASTPA